MGVFGAPVEFAWVATRMRRPHRHNARRHDGRQSEPRASGITLPVTSLPQNERSYHIGTTRADTTERAQRAFRMRDSPHHIEKRSANHVATDAERVGHQLPRAPHEYGLSGGFQPSKKPRSRRGAVNCMPVLGG